MSNILTLCPAMLLTIIAVTTRCQNKLKFMCFPPPQTSVVRAMASSQLRKRDMVNAGPWVGCRVQIKETHTHTHTHTHTRVNLHCRLVRRPNQLSEKTPEFFCCDDVGEPSFEGPLSLSTFPRGIVFVYMTGVVSLQPCFPLLIACVYLSSEVRVSARTSDGRPASSAASRRAAE